MNNWGLWYWKLNVGGSLLMGVATGFLVIWEGRPFYHGFVSGFFGIFIAMVLLNAFIITQKGKI